MKVMLSRCEVFIFKGQGHKEKEILKKHFIYHLMLISLCSVGPGGELRVTVKLAVDV